MVILHSSAIDQCLELANLSHRRDMVYSDGSEAVVILGHTFGEMITTKAKTNELKAEHYPAVVSLMLYESH